MLRNQFSEPAATYQIPLRGVNLRINEADLRADEARLLQNSEIRGAIQLRTGSQRLNSTSLGAFRGLGGHMYYSRAIPPKTRLIAYDNRISAISSTGVETVLTTGMTSGQHTYFNTWSITDKVYISNGSDVLRSFDGVSFITVSGTNIPVPHAHVIPVSDRLLAITANGIERTDPRVDNVWSNNSVWATLRPQRPGMFTAIHPYALRGTDTIYDGAIALQERAYYLINGTDYGSNVVSGSIPPGEDVSFRLLDPIVGTASPDSVCTVPGIGMFWFTADLNVFWLPEGSLVGKFVGTKLQSTGATAGIESTNKAQLKAVWMTYFDHILMLGIPLGTNTYASTQWWMDMRQLQDTSRNDPIVWYGPMIGQTVSKAWVENQQGDNAVYGLEGNSNNGLFVYQLRVPGKFSDALGLTDVPYEGIWQSYFKDFGSATREKYIQAVHFDLMPFSGSATLDLVDLGGDIVTNIPIEAVAES